MERLMDDLPTRSRLAARAVDVRERFGLRAVLGRWHSVFVAARVVASTTACASLGADNAHPNRQ
jgi:hypothetical protein